jgi:FkbM family methyltransferase
MRRRQPGAFRMTLSTALNGTLVRALRLPGPYVPGWYPLVAERAHHALGLGDGDETVEVLGSRMALDPGEYMQRRFYYHCYEAPAVRFFRRTLRPGDTMFDVGAHVGLFTLLAARLVGPSGEVHAFEPVPANFERLGRNVALNDLPGVHLNRAAVGDREGEVSLGLRDESLVGNSTCDFTVGATLSAVTAPTTTLDAYLEARPGTPRIRLVKIDVEGFESRVLAGLERTLATEPPDAIMLELNGQMLFEQGSSPSGLLATLRGAGYELRQLGQTGALRPAPGADEIEHAVQTFDFEHGHRSRLRLGLRTRRMLFNAVAIHERATSVH